MSTPHPENTPDPVFRRRLATAISTAFAGALIIFLGIVMPTEFDRDPLGTGALLGLKGMMNNTAALTEQYEFHKQDEVEFILEPFQSLEYKYLMDQGSTLVFSWQADGELYFDLHAENFTVPDGEATYLQGDTTHQMGTYEAAKKRDVPLLEELGNTLYESCESCHMATR